MSLYRQNHYLPEWYQGRFIPADAKERKFFYLDLRPDVVVTSNAHRYKRNALLRWGPKSCFCEEDLYTTKHGQWISTEIEEKFFGKLDGTARPALDYFATFSHPSVEEQSFHRLMTYMSIQKLRTPKGLAELSERTRRVNKNQLLVALQRLRRLYCAIWTECVWSIADASESPTKFLLSDHPVTVYNQGCFPASTWCEGHRDPDIWLSGTHTLFPLSMDKILILTNLSWVRYPYGNPVRERPHPELFRPAIFNFTHIQTGRKLTEVEVLAINYIVKMRAYRYVAAYDKAWLYPETVLGAVRWNQFGADYLLMPDPRSVTFSTKMFFGGKGWSDSFDAYGQKPWQAGYDDKERNAREWETFHAFQGEFARRFGPKRRGLSFELSRLDKEEDDAEYHKYHLSLEQKHKKHRYKERRGK